MTTMTIDLDSYTNEFDNLCMTRYAEPDSSWVEWFAVVADPNGKERSLFAFKTDGSDTVYVYDLEEPYETWHHLANASSVGSAMHTELHDKKSIDTWEEGSDFIGIWEITVPEIYQRVKEQEVDTNLSGLATITFKNIDKSWVNEASVGLNYDVASAIRAFVRLLPKAYQEEIKRIVNE